MALVPAPVAYGTMIAAVIAARIIQERALRQLTTEEKGRLVEAFSGLRLVSLIPLAAVAGLYFLMTSLGALTAQVMLAIYLPALLIFFVGMHLAIRRKLRALGVHPAYLRAHAIGRGLVLVGFAAVLLAL